MASKEELRESVRRSFPELADIADETLREQVVEAWAFALSETEFTAIEQIRASGNPTTPAMKVRHPSGAPARRGAHCLGDGRLPSSRWWGRWASTATFCAPPRSATISASRLSLVRPIRPAGALIPAKVGYPSVRHPAYGVHVALTVGLPEAIVHTAGAHSAEGENVERSLENTIVHLADHAYWTILRRAGALEEEE